VLFIGTQFSILLEEKSIPPAVKRHWATSCVGARNRHQRLLHPESTLCEGDPGARRRGMVVSSKVSDDDVLAETKNRLKVQGVLTMQCSKRASP